MQICFPKDCWDRNCPYFKVIESGGVDMECYCEPLDESYDAISQDEYALPCPIKRKDVYNE